MATHPIDKLFKTVASRKGGNPEKSYTARLLKRGPMQSAKKLGEEAVEAALAGAARDKKALVSESADVLYHLLVLWASVGITPKQVYVALAAREGQSGLEEKAGRNKSDGKRPKKAKRAKR